MTRRTDRERLGRELEQRGLVPSRSEQARIRVEAERLARRVEQKRHETVAAKARLRAIRAKADDDIDWTDE